MARVVHLRTEPYDVYIGRGSPWGNPYRVGRGGWTRREAIKNFRGFAKARLQNYPDWLEPLRDKVLGCFCKPLACHGDVLVELLGEEEHDARDQSVPEARG